MAERTVTFLFTDIEGSTRRWAADGGGMRAALARHDALLNELIPQHGGTVETERGEGDSFFALFDSALDAVRAAYAIQLALAAEDWPEGVPLRVRMAIHTGHATDDYRGPDVNRCARLRAIADGGQVLLSETTAALVRGQLPDGASLRDLGTHRLKDLTSPERVFQLVHPQLPADFPPLASLDTYRHNLPVQLTSFVGREAELAEVAALVGGHRLVTLTGAGGSGKTRLATQAGAELLDEYEDGVWLIDLAPLVDADLVPAAVAAALSVSEIPGRPLLETLGERLAEQKLLLLLDNCEHLVAACSALADALLRRAPGLRILATSQEALNVAGETAWRVPSLAPEASIALFAERAAAHLPSFALSDANQPTIAQICRRLDGIPLAIELAAARIRLLAPDDILRRLEDRFRLLTAGSRMAVARQQTLRAAVDWSYDLLAEDERTLFRRLSIFAGDFDLEACEEVCRGAALEGLDVLGLLAQLVDKSLVLAQTSGDGSVRYRLLETLRQYGREKLAEADEATDAADAHLRYFLALAERAYAGRIDSPTEWLDRLERDLDNLRAALDSSTGRAGTDLVMAGAMAWFWYLHSEHLSEGADRLGRVLTGTSERTPARARALWGAAMASTWRGQPDEGVSLAEESLSIWREQGDEVEIGLALEALGWAHVFRGDSEAGLPPLREGLAIVERLGHPRLINRLRVALGQVLVALGDVAAAEPLAHESLAAGRQLNEPRDIHYSLHFLGDCSLYRGDAAEAAERYPQSLQAALDYGNVAEAAIEMEGLAMGLAGLGRREKALRLAGAAARKLDETGMDMSSVEFWTAFRRRYLDPATDSIGEARATALDGEGREMGWASAIVYALDTARD